MIFSTTKKTYIVISILILISCGVLYVQLYSIYHLSTTIADTEASIAEQNEQHQHAYTLQSFITKLQPMITSLSSRILSPDGTVGFIESLEQYGKNVGLAVSINTVSVKDVVGHTATNETLTLTFSTKGTWQSTYTFLSILESLPYKGNLETATIAKDPTDKTGKLWNGTYTLSVLKQK